MKPKYRRTLQSDKKLNSGNFCGGCVLNTNSGLCLRKIITCTENGVHFIFILNEPTKTESKK